MVIIDKRKSLTKRLKKAKNIFIMAHKDLDLDALGSSIGMYVILKNKKKNCFLVIDDTKHELGVEKILKELDGFLTIIKSSEVDKNLHKKDSKNLLLILDTNKKDLVQSDSVLKKIKNKIVEKFQVRCYIGNRWENVFLCAEKFLEKF